MAYSCKMMIAETISWLVISILLIVFRKSEMPYHLDFEIWVVIMGLILSLVFVSNVYFAL